MVLWGLRIYGVILYIILCWRMKLNWLDVMFKDVSRDTYYDRLPTIFILLAILTISHMFVNVKWKGEDIVDLTEEDMIVRSFLTIIGLSGFIFIVDSNWVFSLLGEALK